MAKMRKKTDLPNKICPVCSRPFSWRKKWTKDWPSVVYCSNRCRRTSRVTISSSVKLPDDSPSSSSPEETNEFVRQRDFS
jgi:hypothetical protein